MIVFRYTQGLNFVGKGWPWEQESIKEQNRTPGAPDTHEDCP
jgi:hypothetical protein